MTNPTYGWSSDSFDGMLSTGDWSSLELGDVDSSMDSQVTWSESSEFSSSSFDYASASEMISSSEWTTTTDESSMSLSKWFIDTEENWVVDEPQGLSEAAFISGVIGFYDIDHGLFPIGGDDHADWHQVEIIWVQSEGHFTWETKAGVRWNLTPMTLRGLTAGGHGAGGTWDITRLSVGQDSPFYKDGHHYATIEWVSYEYH